MTLADVYLICFIVGFSMTVLAVLSGTHHFHIPGFHHHGHAWHGHAGDHASILSFGNIAAFLTWFGGIGFLLSKFSTLWFWFALPVAVAGGIAGGAVIFWVSLKLLEDERPMNAADYDMIGVLGNLTSGIREDGIGEMSYSQAGSRQSAPARSEDGKGIPKGTEVLVTRYEKGVAYVRRWEESTSGD